MIGKQCIVRAFSAGVFYGTLLKLENREALIADARRLWYWQGAASLSELAVRGVSEPDKCMFPAPVSEALVMEVIEVLPCTPEACASIEGVPVWSAR